MSDAIRAAQGSQATDRPRCESPAFSPARDTGDTFRWTCRSCGFVKVVPRGETVGAEWIVNHPRIAEGTLTPIADTDPDVITEAVAALRCFGADLTLADAMKLLPMWRGFRLLTPAEVDATLRHFAGGAR